MSFKKQDKKSEEIKNESKTVSKAYVRQMQDYQKKRKGNGNLLKEQESQAKAGLINSKTISGCASVHSTPLARSESI